MSDSLCQRLKLQILLELIGIPKLTVAAISPALTDAFFYHDHHPAAASTVFHMAKLELTFHDHVLLSVQVLYIYEHVHIALSVHTSRKART